MISNTIFVTVKNIPKLMKVLQYIENKSEKLDTGGITYSVSDLYWNRYKDENGHPCYDQGVDISYTFETLKKNGYEIVGKIEHVGTDPLVFNYNNDHSNHEYRHVENTRCDHCNTKHHRKNQYILKDENNNEVIVGHTCLKDFMGIDQSILSSINKKLIQLGHDYYGTGSVAAEAYMRVLELSFYFIRNNGWLSGKKAMEINEDCDPDKCVMPTSQYVLMAVFPYHDYFHDYSNAVPSDDDKDNARNALTWLQVQFDDDCNDYIYNNNIIAKRGYARAQEFGMVASVAGSYYNKFLRPEKPAKKESQWIGQEGDRDIFSLTLKKVFDFDTDWGLSRIAIFEDKDQNVVIWKSNTRAIFKLDVDVSINIKGTIKKHDEYKGIKQTLLSRCKVMED